MKRSWKWVAANCAVLIAVAASVAIAASPGRDGSTTNTRERSGDVRRAGPERHLSALAKELGVSESKLRDAFASMRDKLGPPERPSPGSRPSRADLEKRCNELTDALASELGKSGDQVRAAIKAVLKAKLENAVDANRLTRAQADRMLERIDSADCLPPFGPGLFGRGCGHGPGHGPGPRDGDNGSGAAYPAPPPDGGALPAGALPI